MRRVTSGALFAVTLAGSALASTQIPAKPQDHPIALVGGTVHPVSGQEIAGGVVVFDGGKIVAIGKDVNIPGGAERIDVTGKQVYPSLIDANTTIGLIEVGAARATNDMAESGQINPNVKAQVAVNADSELFPVARSNGVTLALAVPQGGLISGQSALIQMDGWTWEEMTLRSPVAMHINWPDMVPVKAWWMRETEEKQIETRDRNLDLIRQAFDEARAYQTARTAAGIAGVPFHGYDSRWEAMIPVLDGKIPIIVNADEIRQIEAAVAFAVSEKVRLVICGGYDAPSCAGLLKKHNVAVIVDGTHRVPRRDDDAYDAAYTVAERLRLAGVPFCIAGGGESANVRNLAYQAAMAVAFGLPKEEALTAITLHPARILGIDDRVGSLDTGKDATIIVTTGDPLEIPSRVEMEFIQGRRIDLSDKQKLLWEKYKEKYRRAAPRD
ncbi:MAG: amidohydrolase family protein [Acidobacteria bacterium]|nr:amidohydrolase family protein [Acidobacteriota bacterium]